MGVAGAMRPARAPDEGGGVPERTGPAGIRVFVVDDHAMIRQALRERLAREPDMEVIGEASTAAAALTEVSMTGPDVAILDVYLPDADGVSLCREIRTAAPETACLMLTGIEDDQALVGAVLAGAAGYVTKHSAGEDLVAAVRMVASGNSALDPYATVRAMELLYDRLAPAPAAPLTHRDKQVLELIAEGLTDGQIARRMSVPEDTARGYVSSLLGKLGLPGGGMPLGQAGRPAGGGGDAAGQWRAGQ